MTATLDRTIRPRVLMAAAGMIKCLGHPLRLRLLEALEAGEKTVSQLQQASRAGQATVSQHLAILRGLGVVDCRRDGASVYYWITEPKVRKIIDCIRQCATDA